jgi:holo-[acyl-carrier protein] synthase
MNEPFYSAQTIFSSSALACGVDLVEIARIERSVTLLGEAFLQRVYTLEELALCAGSMPRLAAHFAAKEAIVKVLGTGFRGIDFNEVALTRTVNGCPIVKLHERAAARAAELHLTDWSISISYSSFFVIAFAVASHSPEQDVHPAQLYADKTAGP